MHGLEPQDPYDENDTRAVAKIEAALQIAFSGEAGTQRLARIIKALDKRQPDGTEDGSLREHLAAAIGEIERLRTRAQERGVVLEGWLAAVANDLSAVQPVPDNAALETVFSLVGRMSAYPARAICAQAGVSRSKVQILTG